MSEFASPVRQFTVVGILAARGVSGVGDADQQVLIPFSTGRFQIFGTDRIQDIWVRAIDEASVVDATFEVQTALRRSHRLRSGQADDFSVRNQSDFLTVLSETTQTFTTLLAGIAAVSLLVGGIGIMNIMLVSVTERTREIGIRKALGATRQTILLQFLTEAMVLCIVGGAVGVAIGTGSSTILRRSFGWDTSLSPPAILLAFAFAAAVGILFGVWPATASGDPRPDHRAALRVTGRHASGRRRRRPTIMVMLSVPPRSSARSSSVRQTSSDRGSPVIAAAISSSETCFVSPSVHKSNADPSRSIRTRLTSGSASSAPAALDKTSFSGDASSRSRGKIP
jgi:hypothetical protein